MKIQPTCKHTIHYGISVRPKRTKFSSSYHFDGNYTKYNIQKRTEKAFLIENIAHVVCVMSSVKGLVMGNNGKTHI